MLCATITGADVPMGLADAMLHQLQVAEGDTRLVETHLSWVMLTPEHAYKLKKPVNLGFADFSTCDARHHACDEELRLNRRMAAPLYEAVLPVTGTVDAPRLDGDGPPIDWVVKMRRFPPGSLWLEQLAGGTLLPQHIDRFAEQLAAFHATAPRATDNSGWGDARLVAASVQDVYDRIEQLKPSAAGTGLRRWLADQAIALAPAWHARLAQGHVREVHGDLHLDNVVRLEGLDSCGFDCLEFDPALRWIDVLSDTAFLVMDLWAHGRRDLAFRFLNAYLEHSGDYAGLPVLRHYLVYRALVRALVGMLQRRLSPPDYLGLAQQLVNEKSARLLITCGLPGSGKTYLSQQLLEATGAIRMRSDVERKRLHGLAPLADSRNSGHGQLYAPEATERTFQHLSVLARLALDQGYPTIVDAASLRISERARFAQVACDAGVPYTVLQCDAPWGVLQDRVHQRSQRRDDASEADLGTLEMLASRREPLTADEQAHAITVDTSHPIDVNDLASRWSRADAALPGHASASPLTTRV